MQTTAFHHSLICVLLLNACNVFAAPPQITHGAKNLPLPGKSFKLDGHDAFVILPSNLRPKTPWVWYAPTLPGLPSKAEVWMFKQFLENGIAIAGIDVGESYGSPNGTALYSQFYDHLVTDRDFGTKPCLLARSRGGLMLYSWAIDHPKSVSGVAGIYPVCSIASYPGVARAANAFELTPAELERRLSEFNPVDRLEPLARAKVPVMHIHGDSDKVVPLDANSEMLATRYRGFDGPVNIEVIAGQGHNMWEGWFTSQSLTNFIIARALELSPRRQKKLQNSR